MSQALIDTHGPALQAYWDGLPDHHQDHLRENPSMLASMVKEFFDGIGIEVSEKTADWIAGGLISGLINTTVGQGADVLFES